MNSSSVVTRATSLAAQAPSTPLSGVLGSSLRAAVLVMVVSGIAYPLLTTVVAQALFPRAAHGSLVERHGQVVGSSLIGQAFSAAGYFHSRPSATTAPDPAHAGASVAAPYNAAASAASNQGATHQGLQDAVAQRVQDYRATNGLAAHDRVPVDAVTASASGLDPHISVANALLQVPRVARGAGVTEAQVQQWVQQATEPRTLGLLGEPRVQVLQLNLALDAHQAAAAAKE